MIFTLEANAFLVIVTLIGKIAFSAQTIVITKKYNQGKRQGLPENGLEQLRKKHKDSNVSEFVVNFFFIILSATLAFRIIF